MMLKQNYKKLALTTIQEFKIKLYTFLKTLPSSKQSVINTFLTR